MTRLTAGAAICIASAAMSACGWLGFRDRGDDYQLADSLPPLQMPAGVEAKRQEELYEIPQIASNALERGEFEVPRPQPLATNVGLDRVKIQKLGNRRWVLVSQPPDQVWPQLSYFLRSSGLNLERADASAGIMETNWLQFEQSPDTRDKYRLRVESGVQPDTTEIHVRHLSIPADTPAPAGGSVNWPAQSTSSERESWMIDEMSTALAAESTGATASLVAQAIGGGSVKVQLQEPAGRDPYISLDLPIDRARATVAHALNVGAYRLHGEDADLGLFYVTYDEDRELSDEEEEGWFSWGDGDEDELAEAAGDVTLQEVLANIDPSADSSLFAGMPGVGGAPAAQSSGKEYPGYLVVLSGDKDRVQVRVRNTRGQPLSRTRASRLLMAIRQNLI